VAQGILGGLRVVLLRDQLALLHGCVAQLFFALLVGIAVVTGRAWAVPSGVAPGAARVAWLGPVAVAVVYGQVVLGAFTTHGTAVGGHLTGAVVSTGVLVAVALAVLRAAPEDRVLTWWARAVKTLLLGQLLLGVGAYAARFTDLGMPGGQVAVVTMPVLHRVVGALLLASTVALALQLGRRRGVLRESRPAPEALAVGTGALA
jgi:cytochrome c oxidase assembly protein subunit 15